MFKVSAGFLMIENMNRCPARWWLVLWGLFLPVFFSKSFAAGHSDSTLAAFVQEAQKKNPQIRAAERRFKAAEQRIPQSWALEDPMFGFAAGEMMIEDVETRVGPQEERYVVSQEIPFPLKLYQKYRIARAEALAAKKEWEAARLEVTSRIKKIYFELSWVNASIAVTNEVRELLQKVQSVAQAQYASGQGSQRDVAKAQVDLSMTYDKLYLFDQQRQSKGAQLKQFLNRPTESDLFVEAELLPPTMVKNLDALTSLALAKRPDIQQKQEEEKKQKEGAKLAGLSYAPDMKLGYEYIVTGDGTTDQPDDGKDAKMFMLEFSVPLWLQKNNAVIAEGREAWREAQENLQEERNKTLFEVRDAFARYTAAMQTVNLYSSSALPQAQLALSSDIAAYESGTGDFLILLDSSRVYLDAKLTYLKAVLEALTALADLERAVGTEFSPQEWGQSSPPQGETK